MVLFDCLELLKNWQAWSMPVPAIKTNHVEPMAKSFCLLNFLQFVTLSQFFLFILEKSQWEKSGLPTLNKIKCDFIMFWPYLCCSLFHCRHSNLLLLLVLLFHCIQLKLCKRSLRLIPMYIFGLFQCMFSAALCQLLCIKVHPISLVAQFLLNFKL